MVKIELGDTVECIYTGFTGIAVSELRFINKCIQFELAGKVGKDNKLIEGTYIDSQSLKIVKRGAEGKTVDKSAGAIKSKIEEEDVDVTGSPNHKHIKMRGY